jgi:hypothetical protein
MYVCMTWVLQLRERLKPPMRSQAGLFDGFVLPQKGTLWLLHNIGDILLVT